jgi:hypothetical protein
MALTKYSGWLSMSLIDCRQAAAIIMQEMESLWLLFEGCFEEHFFHLSVDI